MLLVETIGALLITAGLSTVAVGIIADIIGALSDDKFIYKMHKLFVSRINL